MMKPEEIEHESFRIILSEMQPHSFTSQELPLVQRVIHATGDFEYAALLRFSTDAIEKGIKALKMGKNIFTDVNMVAAGISSRLLDKFGGGKYCLVDQIDTFDLARKQDITRSAAAMRLLGPRLDGAIVAIGNAPTALFEIIRMAQEADVRPALVVGVPVGFVSAKESKEALLATNLNYITSLGRKGGSSVAAAIVNGLLRLATA